MPGRLREWVVVGGERSQLWSGMEISLRRLRNGRIVAVMLMLAGTGLIATVAASVSAYFVGA